VHPKVLLFVHFHAEAFQCPQRREGVENIPLTDAVLSTAENVHFDTAISCRREPFENDRIDVLGCWTSSRSVAVSMNCAM